MAENFRLPSAVVVIVAFALFGANRPIHAQVPTAVDFAAMRVGAPPSGFSCGQTGGGGAGTWTIVDDPSSASRRVLAQTSADQTDYRFPLCLYDAARARDLEVSVRFKAVAGEVDRAAGLIVRAADENNYYVVRANALEGNVNFYKVVKGRRAEIKGARVAVPSGAWHSLRIKARGSRFEISLNDQPLFKVEDGTFQDAGRVGLWTKADSITYFDGLTITPVQE